MTVIWYNLVRHPIMLRNHLHEPWTMGVFIWTLYKIKVFIECKHMGTKRIFCRCLMSSSFYPLKEMVITKSIYAYSLSLWRRERITYPNWPCNDKDILQRGFFNIFRVSITLGTAIVNILNNLLIFKETFASLRTFLMPKI